MAREKITRGARRVKAYASHEGPIHYPGAITRRLQPLLRQALLGLAQYSVKLSGEFPTQPSLLLVYPHSEHADHLLFPTEKIGIVAARDYWFRSILQRAFVGLVVDPLPVDRDNPTRSSLEQELEWQKKFLARGKHIVVYPQGSRLGLTNSQEALQEQMKSGVAFMARQLEVPVHPVVIHHPEGYHPQKGGVNAWDRVLSALKKAQLPEEKEITLEIGESLDYPKKKSQDAAFMALLVQTFWCLSNDKDRR